MRKLPLKKTNSATLKGNLTFQTKFSNKKLNPVTKSVHPQASSQQHKEKSVQYSYKEDQKSIHHIS